MCCYSNRSDDIIIALEYLAYIEFENYDLKYANFNNLFSRGA